MSKNGNCIPVYAETEELMKRNRTLIETLASGLSAIALLTTTVLGGIPSAGPEAKAQSGAGAAISRPSLAAELPSKRSQFTKQFAMSDGSFTAVTYSMPAHYKKNGTWREIDTTFVKSGKKSYKTKSTDLLIKAAKKAASTSTISLKRSKYTLSFALKGKKIKASKARISNPQKTEETQVLNQNRVEYKKVWKNTNVSYDIFPEKIQEIITVKKKQKNKSFSFTLKSGKLNGKVKNKKITFKTKKGKTKYTRLATVLTDANGVSTTKVKLSYNQKKGILKVTPDKKWWNSKKRKFPVEIRTAYTTDQHSRDVRVAAAYAGAPASNLTYDKSLLLQANKSVSFVKMTNLAELSQPNVKIRDAALHIRNEKELKLGAGKTFDIGVHKVTQDWSAKKLTYNNRPSYDPAASAVFGIQKKGNYACDVTEVVKAWYGGEANNGVALAADNSNRSYQAKIDRSPYFTVHYEVVGLEGAVELAEGAPVTRAVLTAGQENYYFFDAKPGIAYDVYSDSSIDTQATMYDGNREDVGYDDDSGLDRNFLFTGAYDGRRYVKVSVKNGGTGEYTVMLKKRFAVPEPAGIKGQDKYTITWNAVEHAKEYLVRIYDGGVRVGEAVVTGTSYDHVYTNETAGKTLGFTVTARESASLTGEESRMIFNTDSQSEWVYTAPMQEGRKGASAVTCGRKIYVLGGENTSGPLKSFAVYDTETKTWEPLPDYPGTETGVCRATMLAYNKEIYVIGGQTDTGMTAKILNSVYVFDTESKQWHKKADMAEGRTSMAAAVSRDQAYIYSKAGATDRAAIYHFKTDTWETVVMPDTSRIIDAAGVDGRVFVLREEEDRMCWSEYLPEDNVFDEAGDACPFASSDRYRASAVIRGKIYMAREAETKEVLVYDCYTGEWAKLPAMNLMKQDCVLAASENEIYSIGGEMAGFGVLDVVEQYSVKVQATVREMLVTKGECYELQVTAGNLKKGQEQVITVRVDPKELHIQDASSFEEKEALQKGVDGVTLLKYQPKKGVMVLKLTGSLERGESYEAYHSIPVEAAADGKTEVEIIRTAEK